VCRWPGGASVQLRRRSPQRVSRPRALHGGPVEHPAKSVHAREPRRAVSGAAARGNRRVHHPESRLLLHDRRGMPVPGDCFLVLGVQPGADARFELPVRPSKRGDSLHDDGELLLSVRPALHELRDGIMRAGRGVAVDGSPLFPARRLGNRVVGRPASPGKTRLFKRMPQPAVDRTDVASAALRAPSAGTCAQRAMRDRLARVRRSRDRLRGRRRGV